jgi:hypothetical protein
MVTSPASQAVAAFGSGVPVTMQSESPQPAASARPELTLTTLIPAYRADFLADLFKGLAAQTFRNFRVVLSDDSPDASVTRRIAEGAFSEWTAPLHMTIIRGPRTGSMNNLLHLLQHWRQSSPLVHLLMDDDIVYPDFYRMHEQAHRNARISASVSQRWAGSAQGTATGRFPLPEPLEAAASGTYLLESQYLFQTTVPACRNWLGELSNVVLNAESAMALSRSCMRRLRYYGLGDIGVLLDVSRQAPIAYVRETLGVFRMHATQSSQSVNSFPLKCGVLAWIAIALDAWADGRIDSTQAVRAIATAIANCEQLFPGDPAVLSFMARIEPHIVSLDSFYEGFESAWNDWLDSNVASAMPNALLAGAH